MAAPWFIITGSCGVCGRYSLVLAGNGVLGRLWEDWEPLLRVKMTVTDRAQLEPFLAALDASATALERPNCRGWMGDYQITGKHGHVLADHPGYLLYVTGTVQRWKKAKRILPGTVTQDGDDEGIVRLDRLPTPAEAESIRDLIGIRKRRHMTADALSALERARGAIKSPFSDSPMRYFAPEHLSPPSITQAST